MKKILIIRFSSIGDIVLTTPVIRCLKKHLPGTEIHYCTKKQYANVLEANPYLSRIHCLENSLKELADRLKSENFDFIVDLHNNLRSCLLKAILRLPSKTFPKLNFSKWLLVHLKINRLPDTHIVDRYFKAILLLHIHNDGLGLDYFIPDTDCFDPSWLPVSHQKGFTGFIIGGRHNTKIFPTEKVISVCRLLNQPIVLLGGKEDASNGELIAEALPGKVFNSCGKFTINRSAALVKEAYMVITNDTGLMHVAAAFKKKIISLWGNTVPEFGMYPYLPENLKNNAFIIELRGIKCRPCSKIGFNKCPRKHFDCMNRLDTDYIAGLANRMIKENQ